MKSVFSKRFTHTAGALFLFSLGLPFLLPAQEKAAKPKPVTFVVYNLKNYLAMDRRVDGESLDDAPKPEAEIAALLDGIKAMQPEVLGICEIGDPDYLNDFLKRLREIGLEYPHTELVRAQSGYDRNLALLSIYPIVARNSNDSYSYKIEEKTIPFQRGVLDVTLAINPQYRLRCIGLHLKSKRKVKEAPEHEMRLQEATLARAHIDQVLEEEPGANLLVYGDFNDLRIEAPVKKLQGRFGRWNYLTSLMLADQYGFRWTHHWAYADSYARFDFALVSKGLSPEIDRDQSHIYHWKDWDLASDHRPLVVKIIPQDQIANK